MNFPKITYSDKYLLELIEKKEVDNIKNYINTYFFKLANTEIVLFWNVSENRFELLTDAIIKARYLPNYLKVKVPKAKKFPISFWFFSTENTGYYLCNKMNKPTIFIEETTQTNFINLFPILLHANKQHKKLVEYSSDIQKKVARIWEHIQIVWCSRKQDQFFIAQKWLSKLVSGQKLKSALYLQSVEGIGKSIIIEFLSKYVLGEDLILQTANSTIISDKFNAPLIGKLLFCLEEAPCASYADWKMLDSKLKNIITESRICLEKKGKDQIMIENTCSLILNTNNTALQANPFTRRYIMLDTSIEKRGKTEYFNDLLKIMAEPEVGEAFYFHCIDITNQNLDFNESEVVITDNLKKNISDNANSLYQYIKEVYVLKNKPINIKYASFHNNYLEYCKNKKIHSPIKKSLAVDRLKEIEINYIKQDTKHHNYNWISNTNTELIKLFEKYHLIGDVDDIQNDKNNENDEDQEDIDEIIDHIENTPTITKLKTENELLKEENAKLKAQVNIKTKIKITKIETEIEQIEKLCEQHKQILKNMFILPDFLKDPIYKINIDDDVEKVLLCFG